MQRSGTLAMVTCALWAALAVGCLERKGATAGPEIGFGQVVSLRGGGVTEVDLLFVIDNSRSMREEQQNLVVQIPRLVRDLAEPPDRDGNGQPDWAAVESLRIAVTTTDVGTGSVQVSSSNCRPGGDDGELRGGIFEWTPGDDPDAFAAEIGTVVQSLGEGCAFEQQLEATARALQRARALGFPRQSALLAVVVVTDEEDCSIDTDDVFFGAIDPLLYNVHCTRNDSQLTPVRTLVERIRGGRSDDEIVFAAITGIPRDGATEPSAVLDHPDMQYREMPSSVNARVPTPVPVCEFVTDDGTSLGEAAPARRLVRAAAELPGSVLRTICTDDFGPAIAQITERIGSRASGVCLVRELPEQAGLVPCEVNVRLPQGESCSSYPGYVGLTSESDGRELCAVTQVPSGSTNGGWFYDPSRDGCPQLAFTEAGRPPVGSDVLAECFFPVLREDGEQCARASQCESNWCDPVARACAPLPELPGEEPRPTGE